MTHEQFVFWLKGYTEGKSKLTDADFKLIKDKLSEIQIPFTFTSNPLIQPYQVYCGTT